MRGEDTPTGLLWALLAHYHLNGILACLDACRHYRLEKLNESMASGAGMPRLANIKTDIAKNPILATPSVGKTKYGVS